MRHHLYLLFTPSLCRAEPFATLLEALRGGVDLVQWRAKGGGRDEARRCIDLCAEHEVAVIVNDDVELAIELGARGAHVGQDDMPAREARAKLGEHRLLGVSTHDLTQVARAIADGADHLGFGPMFPTATKGYQRGQAPGSLRAALEQSTVPIWPIGGINLENIDVLRREGARRAAVSSAILHADDPRRTAAALRNALAR